MPPPDGARVDHRAATNRRFRDAPAEQAAVGHRHRHPAACRHPQFGGTAVDAYACTAADPDGNLWTFGTYRGSPTR